LGGRFFPPGSGALCLTALAVRAGCSPHPTPARGGRTHCQPLTASHSFLTASHSVLVRQKRGGARHARRASAAAALRLGSPCLHQGPAGPACEATARARRRRGASVRAHSCSAPAALRACSSHTGSTFTQDGRAAETGRPRGRAWTAAPRNGGSRAAETGQPRCRGAARRAPGRGARAGRGPRRSAGGARRTGRPPPGSGSPAAASGRCPPASAATCRARRASGARTRVERPASPLSHDISCLSASLTCSGAAPRAPDDDSKLLGNADRVRRSRTSQP